MTRLLLRRGTGVPAPTETGPRMRSKRFVRILLEVLRERRLPRGRRGDPRGRQSGRHTKRRDPRPQRPLRPRLHPVGARRAWPAADLIVIEDSGHAGSATIVDEMHAAAERLCEQITTPTSRAARNGDPCAAAYAALTGSVYLGAFCARAVAVASVAAVAAVHRLRRRRSYDARGSQGGRVKCEPAYGAGASVRCLPRCTCRTR